MPLARGRRKRNQKNVRAKGAEVYTTKWGANPPWTGSPL